MATFSVIPGAASNTRLRALVIAQDALSAPTVTARARTGTATCTITQPVVSAELSTALRDRRVSVRLVDVEIPDAPAAGTQVALEVTVDGRTQPLNLQTLPRDLPKQGLSFIVASCFDAQFKLGERLRAGMSAALPDHPPATFQLWVGDNVYMDVPGFPKANQPYHQTLDRYLRYLLTSSYVGARQLHPNFTTYDDHELWNDYPEEQTQLTRSRGDERRGYMTAALQCLALFQSDLNLNRASDDGLSYRIDFSEVSFFVADTRTQRDRARSASSSLMTEADLSALEKWCENLSTPGLLVVGQPLWIAPRDDGIFGSADHNPPFFRAHYERIWSALRAAPFDILILTGDIHYSRLMHLSMQNAENRKVFELVTSPASEIPTEVTSALEYVLGTGVTQDTTATKAPSNVPGSAQKLKAESLFATSSPNSFARVTLRPIAKGVIEVGASFVDYARGPSAIASYESVQGVPKWGTKNYTQCHEPRVCALRMR